MEENKFESANIKLIVGLGNLHKDYLKTRHNVGFHFLDYLSKNAEFKEEKKFKAFTYSLINANYSPLLAKPTTMMNNSGESVQAIMNFYKLSSNQVAIVFDDLDLKLGEFKLQFLKYPKVHNGINSIIDRTGTDRFNFIRIGIDNRNENQRKFMSGADYVLSRFENEEIKILHSTFDTITKNLDNKI